MATSSSQTRPRSSQPHHAHPPYPLYGPAWSLHRVSPLYNGSAPLLASLAIHARRFQDIIKGDVLRGIQLAHGEHEAGAGGGRPVRDRGAFRSCAWELLGDDGAWRRRFARRERHEGEADVTQDGVDEEEEDEMAATLAYVSTADARGVRIEIVYERATYLAILTAPDPSASSLSSPASRQTTTTARAHKQHPPLSRNGFTHLPILLLKMPAALRTALQHYLRTAFDAHIAPMPLSRATMSAALERVLAGTLAPYEADLRPVVAAFPRGLHLQLGFPCTEGALRSLEIAIEQADLLPFLQRGRVLLQQQQRTHSSTDNSDDADVEREAQQEQGPFLTALTAYLRTHLALDLQHRAVTLRRVALGPYLLAAEEGKVRILDPSNNNSNSNSNSNVDSELEANDTSAEVWQLLFRAAQARGGDGAHSTTNAGALDSAGAGGLGDKAGLVERARARAARMDGLRWGVEGRVALDEDGGTGGRVPSDPPPPYEMHDPALRDELMDDV